MGYYYAEFWLSMSMFINGKGREKEGRKFLCKG